MGFWSPTMDRNQSIKILRDGSISQAKEVLSSIFVLVKSHEKQVYALELLEKKKRLKESDMIGKQLMEYNIIIEKYKTIVENRRNPKEREQLMTSVQATKIKIANLLAIIQATEQQSD